MKKLNTLTTTANVLLYYPIKNKDEVAVVIGNKDIYNDEIQWLIRGDYADYARYWNLFDVTPIGWKEIK